MCEAKKNEVQVSLYPIQFCPFLRMEAGGSVATATTVAADVTGVAGPSVLVDVDLAVIGVEVVVGARGHDRAIVAIVAIVAVVVVVATGNGDDHDRRAITTIAAVPTTIVPTAMTTIPAVAIGDGDAVAATDVERGAPGADLDVDAAVTVVVMLGECGAAEGEAGNHREKSKKLLHK